VLISKLAFMSFNFLPVVAFGSCGFSFIGIDTFYMRGMGGRTYVTCG
jgi:hypothetical protein